jgi:PAS domain S-box-containing protein
VNSRSATILIVDDEAQNRRLLEALLRPEGYDTVSVANGEDALASIALTPPDLILLDVMMPGMDGYQVARTLKADSSTSHIPIIMVTAQIDRSARLAGLEAGAEEFLTKPIDRAELWLRVRNLLRLKSFADFLQGHSGLLERAVQDHADELRDVQARFSGFMESSPVLAWVNDEQGHVLYSNRAWADVLGIDPRDEGGSGRVERSELFGKLNAGEQAQLARGEVVRRPLWIAREDGSFRCWNSIKFPIREASGRMLVGGMGIDITDQKSAEMEVLSLNATLEQRIIDRTAVLEQACETSDRARRDAAKFLAALGGEAGLPAGLVDGIRPFLLSPGEPGTDPTGNG